MTPQEQANLHDAFVFVGNAIVASGNPLEQTAAERDERERRILEQLQGAGATIHRMGDCIQIDLAGVVGRSVPHCFGAIFCWYDTARAKLERRAPSRRCTP